MTRHKPSPCKSCCLQSRTFAKGLGILLDRIPNLAILAHSSLTIAGSDGRPDCFLILSGQDGVVDLLNVSIVALLLVKASTNVQGLNPNRWLFHIASHAA